MFDKTTLADGFYLVEFDYPGSPRGVARTVIECQSGFCYTTNDAAYEDGPLPMAETIYRVIEKIDLWVA